MKSAAMSATGIERWTIAFVTLRAADGLPGAVESVEDRKFGEGAPAIGIEADERSRIQSHRVVVLFVQCSSGRAEAFLVIGECWEILSLGDSSQGRWPRRSAAADHSDPTSL